ncbi:SDR family NAD(P)-dependent oxidoreductase [Phaeovulum sp. W22_SRMD_FR3]|uniref:SDR family NAD(P)-dependent oxidoreductase n=1 Tax=Phaeovulum sp. W22_SRMD_FR3 TaxID=3240274 RepID=UPI003F9B6156
MTILITGANRGIGAAMLAQYRSEGRPVLGTARHPGDSGLLPLDIADPASLRALADHLADRQLSLLICNAGVYPGRNHRLEDGYPPEDWAEGFATNVTGTFLTIQCLLPQLRAGQGKIAIISSQMGSSTRAPGGNYIYRASKAAVLNLGRNLASDLRTEGLPVGIYHPGWVQTDMGGAGAEISTEASAAGLIARFDALSPATTGCFETWDGRPHAL